LDNLESTILDIQEEICELRSRRTQIDKELEHRKTSKLELQGRPPDSHRHRCPHCGAYAVCPQAYGEDCPLEPAAPAVCCDDPYGGE
jgi:hypothetical protein